MARFKGKIKKNQLEIAAKLDKDEQLHEVDMAIFTRKEVGCLFKVSTISKGKIEYVGSEGISLAECLSMPITKNNFFCILELIANFSMELNKNRLSIARIILDMNYVYYNEQTATIQFIYLPLVQTKPGTNMLQFVRDFVTSAKPMQGQDMNFVARTMNFIGSMNGYDPNQIEQFVMRECNEAIVRIKGGNMASNVMNGIQGNNLGMPNRNANANVPQGRPPMGIIPSGIPPMGNAQAGTPPMVNTSVGVPQMTPAGMPSPQMALDSDEVTVRFGRPNANRAMGMDQTPVMNQVPVANQAPVMNQMQTGGLNQIKPELATGGMNQSTNYNQASVYNPDIDDETGLLSENVRYMPEQRQQANYPKLKRVSTNEIIQIDRPVFRVGKEKATVDYYVDNNGAVSRNHADIVVRGNQYFVIDLNSKNRTFINGRVIPIRQETVLYDGDRLKLANEEFIFTVS